MNGDSKNNIDCLKIFESLVKSGFGVASRPKLISNGVGGDNIISSISSRIFSGLKPSNVGVKFILNAVLRHVKLYKDGGWSTAYLACRLILDAKNVGMPRRLASEIFDMMITHCLEHLENDTFKSKTALNLNSVDHMMGLVRCIINPKSINLSMNQSTVEDLKRKIVKYFLTYSSNKENTEHKYCRVPQHIINLGTLPTKVDLVEGVALDISGNLMNHLKKNIKRENLILALYECSLTNHDYEDLNVTFETTDRNLIEKTSVQIILNFIETLTNSISIDILISQKVIHPKIKHFLMEKGIMAIERIGLEKMKSIHCEVGGTVASSFNQPLTQSDMGHAKIVFIEQSVENSCANHLRIVGLERVCYLVIDTMISEDADEILHLFESSIFTLGKALETGVLMKGKGEWAKELAEILKDEVPLLKERWSEIMECKPRQVELVIEICLKSFQKLHHIINQHDDSDNISPEKDVQESSIFDLYDQVKSCLQTSFFLTSTMLKTMDFL